MKQLVIYIGCIAASIWLIGTTACVHQPWIPDGEPVPVDTTGTGSGNNQGGSNNNGNPCSPDSIYFALQILPILQSNCAMSGCHDAASAQDGVILTDYTNVMNTADVRPFDLDGSDLYEVITETDPDKVMPPPPNNTLSSDQIQLIAQWINQGALNLTCNDAIGCDTVNVSFANTVFPVLQDKCVGCHSGNNPSGGIDLNSYTTVKIQVNNGQLFGAINHESGFSPMPKGGNQLPQCEIDQVKSWIDAGAPNN